MNIQPKERPILFSGEMVRAILDGRKKMTRRIVAAQSDDWLAVDRIGDEFVPVLKSASKPYGVHASRGFRCPYGKPGDRLWVRETWQVRDDQSYYTKADTKLHKTDHPDCAAIWNKKQPPEAFPMWLSPIFMPRWASRITLEITGVRVERLQSISEADAEAEGVEQYAETNGNQSFTFRMTHRATFSSLWDKINGKRASWESNPWVWVIEFCRASR